MLCKHILHFAVLFSLQRQEGKFSEHRARFYFGEIILALDYLHSFGIVFRYDLHYINCSNSLIISSIVLLSILVV